MSRNIHPTAIIHPNVKMGDQVTIEPYAIINSPHVVLEDGVTIKSHAYIDGYTTIGAETTIFPFACIGTTTQDLKYRGERTFVKIGKRCKIREYVTINSSCGEDTSVTIGDDCLIMACSHVAHNCTIGNHVIMSNGVLIAGHVIVEDHVTIAGMCGIHQFVRIGAHSMIGAMSRLMLDFPPYFIGGDNPIRLGGINLVGLKRRSFPLQTRVELSKAFKILYRSDLEINKALEKIERELEPLPEIQHLVMFCRQSRRGLAGFKTMTQEEAENPDHTLEKENLPLRDAQ